MTGAHSKATRERIGASRANSAWRRQQRDQSNELQSAAGHAGEDYTTSAPRSPHRYLWEETHGYAD
jgi:hypothetical protein